MSDFDKTIEEARNLIEGIRSEDVGIRELSVDMFVIRMLQDVLRSAHLGALARYADTRDQIIRELRGESPETADVEEETE